MVFLPILLHWGLSTLLSVLLKNYDFYMFIFSAYSTHKGQSHFLHFFLLQVVEENGKQLRPLLTASSTAPFLSHSSDPCTLSTHSLLHKCHPVSKFGENVVDVSPSGNAKLCSQQNVSLYLSKSAECLKKCFISMNQILWWLLDLSQHIGFLL